MGNWKNCKNLLIIRADNMGDLLMSSPAIRTIKEFINCRITVLTSSKSSPVVCLIPEIDAVMEFNVPWMKLAETANPIDTLKLIKEIKQRDFDGCIVFNVYSQNPLPAIMLAYMANIPLRLAYCRENPYGLLSDWLPDPEPFEYIRHQVERDLDLVAVIGGFPFSKRIILELNPHNLILIKEKINTNTCEQLNDSFFILHPGVSELKRRYPKELWIEAGKLVIKTFGCPVLLTGSEDEQPFNNKLKEAIGDGCFSVAGLFSIEELAILIQMSKALISVNTVTIHIAAAVQTSTVVLYAQTNPQHTPWMVNHKLLEFSVPGNLKSKNKVIQWVNEKLYSQLKPYPTAVQVVVALQDVLKPKE